MRTLSAALLCSLLIAGAARADTPAFRPFDSVMTVMDDLSPNTIEDGANKDSIVNAVNAKLAAANVVVYPDGGQVPLTLEISVDSIKAPGNKVYAFDVKMSAETTVAITQPPYTQTTGSIWSVSTIDLCNTQDIQSSLKQAVLSSLNLFIREYMAQHPLPQR